jgi:DNA-binding MarR family transcriptional regulator
VIKMSGKMGDSQANSISALQERALGLVGSKSDGLFQSELRRLLGIDSSKCSRIVSKMQASGIIYREKVPASSTFLIRLVQPNGKAVSFGHIDSYLTEIYLLYLIRGVSS